MKTQTTSRIRQAVSLDINEKEKQSEEVGARRTARNVALSVTSIENRGFGTIKATQNFRAVWYRAMFWNDETRLWVGDGIWDHGGRRGVGGCGRGIDRAGA